jgi:hypothetical protein
MAKKEQPSKGRKKWPTGPKQPIVFAFRPLEYEIVPPERLKEWQESMIKGVGLPRQVVERMGYTGHEVESFSAGGLDD